MNATSKLAVRGGAVLAAAALPLAAAAPSFAAASAPHASRVAAPGFPHVRHSASAQDAWVMIESNSALLDGYGKQQYVTTASDPIDVACYITGPAWGYGTWYYVYEVDDPAFLVGDLWTAAENFAVPPSVPAC